MHALQPKLGQAPRWILCGLLLLTLARLWLSFQGLNYGLPHAHEPDAELVRQSLAFRGDAPAKSQQMATYPHLLSRLMALMPRPESPEAIPSATDLERHKEFAARHFLAARSTVALLTALAIPLLYRLARSFFPPAWALYCAALLATSLLFFDYSQQARPHGPLTAFLLLALVTQVQLARDGRLLRYLLAGTTTALALGSLHSGACALFGGATAHFYAARGRPASFHARLILPLLCIGIGLRLFYPFFFHEDASQANASGVFPHRLRDLSGAGFLALWNYLWDYDPILWGLALVGGGSLLWQQVRRLREQGAHSFPEFWVCAWVFLSYFLALGVYSSIFVRFLMPLLPAAALLGTYGLRLICTNSFLGKTPTFLAKSLAALALLLPAYLILQLTRVRLQPDSATRAAEWLKLQEKGTGGLVLLSPTLSLPLLHEVGRHADYDPWLSSASHFWHRYLYDLPPGTAPAGSLQVRHITRLGTPYMDLKDYPSNRAQALAYLDALDGDYAVVTYGGTLLNCVRDAVRERGELAWQITPWENRETQPPVGLTPRGDDFWRKLLRARHPGPVLEIYRLH